MNLKYQILHYIVLCTMLVQVLGSDINDECTSNDDCQPPYTTCNISKQEWEHKNVFPLELMEFFGSIILGVMIALSNAGGIGGGGIIVPIMIVFFSFSTKESIALSGFCIFCASLMRFIINYNQKHPHKDAKVVDYGIIMVMFPTMLLGSLIGVQINILLPNIILLTFLTVILFLLAINSFFTALKLKKKDDQSKMAKVEAERAWNEIKVDQSKSEGDIKSSSNNTLSKDVSKSSFLPPINKIKQLDKSEERNNNSHNDVEEEEDKVGEPSKEDISKPAETERKIIENDEERKEVERSNNPHPSLQKIIKREQTHCKPVTLVMVPSLFFVLILLSLLRGNSNFDSIIGIESCSALNIVFLLLIILFYMGMTAVNIVLIKQEYKTKVKYGYEFAEGDLQWKPKLLIQFIISAFAAGFVAGSVGLGGGTIFNPLLLSFKVPPTVASSSGMFMIMWGALSNVFLYIFAGYLDIGFAFWCGAFVAVGTAIGIKIVNDIIKRTGRTSYLAFLLVLVIAICAVVVPIFGGIQIGKDSQNGDDIWKFGSFWE